MGSGLPFVCSIKLKVTKKPNWHLLHRLEDTLPTEPFFTCLKFGVLNQRRQKDQGSARRVNWRGFIWIFTSLECVHRLNSYNCLSQLSFTLGVIRIIIHSFSTSGYLQNCIINLLRTMFGYSWKHEDYKRLFETVMNNGWLSLRPTFFFSSFQV